MKNDKLKYINAYSEFESKCSMNAYSEFESKVFYSQFLLLVICQTDLELKLGFYFGIPGFDFGQISLLVHLMPPPPLG